MEQAIEVAVKRAVTTMRDNLGQPLTIDDMARSAMFSKFHFTRVFQRVTGISPGRFLSALRLQHAQQLLVSTPLRIADISQRVGYNSVGTFSTRFSRSVGMSPTEYRLQSGFALQIVAETDESTASPTGGRVQCRIRMPQDDQPRLIFAGLFSERIPQGRPVRCAVLADPEHLELDDVPAGTWYLLAQSVPGSCSHPDGYQAKVNESVSVASLGPITVAPRSVVRSELEFNSAGLLDPPVLLALMDVRKLAMEIVAQRTQAPVALAAGATGPLLSGGGW
ncbi:helix-turn-helix transcriptional regulator [Micromonospora sp. DR5-3]|uniref:AraC family transcriptional regulator n=1 Tax=unclassified Micromonospora TaxID=2617518 RepID=UPI0011D59501|nr:MULTISPECIES: helix-turn-helix transcriptional regulator [unclassified Micromonospora]MCW3818280.1 helix-turn-helix transcriptional regulator [Micromonospora sp. DR5-3]TYC21496.1 helix-turn-helix transcriptional regulator [Micromonospora sp. MP36]